MPASCPHACRTQTFESLASTFGFKATTKPRCVVMLPQHQNRSPAPRSFTKSPRVGQGWVIKRRKWTLSKVTETK